MQPIIKCTGCIWCQYSGSLSSSSCLQFCLGFFFFFFQCSEEAQEWNLADPIFCEIWPSSNVILASISSRNVSFFFFYLSHDFVFVCLRSPKHCPRGLNSVTCGQYATSTNREQWAFSPKDVSSCSLVFSNLNDSMILRFYSQLPCSNSNVAWLNLSCLPQRYILP